MLQNVDTKMHVIGAAPPLGVSVVTLFGWQLSDVAYAATIIYTTLLIVHFVWTKWLRPFFRRG